MVRCIIVALVSGWLMAQQPKDIITQTKLPPPGVAQAKPAPAPPPSAAVKESAPREKQDTVKEKPAPKDGKPSGPKTETAPSSGEGGKQPTGKRVAAFWTILPGK